MSIHKNYFHSAYPFTFDAANKTFWLLVYREAMIRSDINMDDEGSSPVVHSKPAEGWTGWVESVILRVSQTSIGQSLLKLVDRFLWVVEKSTEWSLPDQEVAAEENGKSFGTMKRVRPLPWILFLPGLVVLRAIRGGLNLGAFILGYPRIQPSGMVKFVQKSRKRLRAFNLKAIKNLRHKNVSAKDKRLSMIEAKKALIRSIKLTLSTLSCLDSSKTSPSPPPTKICITGMELKTAADDTPTGEIHLNSVQIDSKRKYSEVSGDEVSDESENETLQSKIERFALEDSMEDPDFNPAECSTESATSSSEGDEQVMNVSSSELLDITQEAQIFLNTTESMAPGLLEKENNSQQTAIGEKLSENQMDVLDVGAFHSPTKTGSDYDPAFYSPISSKSASPERSQSSCPETESELYKHCLKTSDVSNGEVNVSTTSESTTSGASMETTISNGVLPEKRSSYTSKYHNYHHHNKGKRTNHGNRRKK